MGPKVVRSRKVSPRQSVETHFVPLKCSAHAGAWSGWLADPAAQTLEGAVAWISPRYRRVSFLSGEGR